MSDSRPQRPPNPKHVPFWPFLVAFAALIAVTIAGTIASDRAREAKGLDNALPVTSTSTTALSPGRTAPGATTPEPPSTSAGACTSRNLLLALQSSGKAMGSSLTMTQFKCVSGWALARVVPGGNQAQAYTADFQLRSEGWAVLDVGQVDPPADGVPLDVAAQLVLR